MPIAAKVDDLKPSSDDSYQEVLDSALAEFTAEGVDLDAPLNASDSPETPAEQNAAALTPASAEEVAQPVGDAPAEVVAETPASAAVVETAPAVDPLADTAPLDYVFDGQAKAFDGILIDKTNGGAFILPDKLDAVRTRLMEGDRLTGDVKRWQDRATQYDGISYTNGLKGEEKEHRGIQAVQQLRADVEANAAAGKFLLKTLADAFPGRENAAALLNVFKQAEFEHKRVAFEAGQQFAKEFNGRISQQVNAVTQGSNEQRWFSDTITAIHKALPGLTAADVEAGRQFFAKRPQLLYRNATAQDAAKYGLKVGERMGDPDAMNEWYAERAASRAEEVKQATARAPAADTAGKHNAGMEKGRQTGKKPVQARRANTSATPAATIPEKVSKKQVYTDILDEAMQELGISD